MIVIHVVLWVYFASRSSFPNATTSWTHFYINKDCVASQNFLEKKCVNKEASICSATKYGGIQKFESLKSLKHTY
uniref:Secreted protein n=1 Tax=Brassica oleracea var. oleracea TaxID=109376 RepID=A0A0D3CNT4_BRAOL